LPSSTASTPHHFLKILTLSGRKNEQKASQIWKKPEHNKQKMQRKQSCQICSKTVDTKQNTMSGAASPFPFTEKIKIKTPKLKQLQHATEKTRSFT
jgi:hypothetical protein